jgi:hypothetical protein
MGMVYPCWFWETDVARSISSKYIILFQSFPNIRSIFGWNLSKPDEDLVRISDRYPVTSGLGSSLTHLDLKRSYLTQQDLCAILKIPKALQTFIYDIVPENFLDPDYPGISPEDIFLALAPHRDSLENLWLEIEPVINIEHYANVSSLSNFVCLKSLRVLARVLDLFGYIDCLSLT